MMIERFVIITFILLGRYAMNRFYYLIGITFILCFLYADSIDELNNIAKNEQFMTEREYGSYLYQDPRGVSCKRCHGENGKGQNLVTYNSGGRTINITAPDITRLDLQYFTKALKMSKGIMPKYYLTDSEIQSIYKYISDNSALE